MKKIARMTKSWKASPGQKTDKAYKYDALDDEHEEFRLLTLVPSRDPNEPLRGSIQIVRPDWRAIVSDDKYTGPRWTALSYVWTDPDEVYIILDGQELKDTKRNCQILVDNAPLNITSNLFHALMPIRGYESFRTVWVDQLCIDQSNLQERASQIDLMHMIFSAAQSVLVWLGWAIRQEKTDMFVQLMGWIHSPNRVGRIEDIPSLAQYTIKLSTEDPALCPPVEENHHLFAKQMVKDILEDPWFRRSWVQQEAVFPKSLLVCLGPVIVPWDIFEDAVSGLSHWSIPWSTSEDSALATTHRLGLQTLKKTRDWQENQCKHSTLLPSAQLSMLLQGLRVSQATDARDKVYAFWHMSDQSFRAQKGYINKLPVSYEKRRKEVYGYTVVYCIGSEKTLDVISCACKFETSGEGLEENLWSHLPILIGTKDCKKGYSELLEGTLVLHVNTSSMEIL